MTVIEVHPEELLDRELRGPLTERERVLLTAHLQRCSACRMERQLRRDFERELAAPAQGLDLQMFVSDAIQAVERPNVAPAASAAGASGTGRRTMRRVAAAMAACVALSAGVGIGAAQLGLAERAWQAVREGVATALGSRAARKPARVAPASAHPTPPSAAMNGEAREQLPAMPSSVSRVETKRAEPARPPALQAERERAAQRVPTEAPIAALSAARSRAPTSAGVVRGSADSRRGSTASVRGSADSGRGSAPIVGGSDSGRGSAPMNSANVETPASAANRPAAETAAESPRAPSESSAALFEKANRVRHQGHAIEASGLYRELQARYPASAEARLSIAVVARMQLDQGENTAALAGFETYLTSSDTALREEAMVGRVRALQRLGRAREARDAAQSLLDVYPSSAFAAAARKLLESSAP